MLSRLARTLLLLLQVLKAFQTARQTYIMQCVSVATGAGADTDLDSLAVILADVATLVGGACSAAGRGCPCIAGIV